MSLVCTLVVYICLTGALVSLTLAISEVLAGPPLVIKPENPEEIYY